MGVVVEFEESVKLITLLLANGVEGVAALIIGWAVLKSVFTFFKNKIHQSDELEIRLMLGKSLALALEFLLAADILRTAITPTWDEVGKLAAIACLRTLLNYFLERELKRQHE